MSLQVRLSAEMKAAMKAKDSLRLSTLRLVLSAVKNREIDKRQELDDQGVTEVLATLVKQRRESIKVYTDGGRPDLAAKEEAELACLQEFLPRQLSREELVELVRGCIAAAGATGPREMGQVMKLLMPQVAGRADGKLVNDLVRELLA